MEVRTFSASDSRRACLNQGKNEQQNLNENECAIHMNQVLTRFLFFFFFFFFLGGGGGGGLAVKHE